MREHEAINCSLATLEFCFNNKYAFFKIPFIIDVYKRSEIFDINAKTEKDFDILTNNALLCAIQSHAITMNDAVKAFCKRMKRPPFKSDPFLDPIRHLLGEWRNAKVHLEKKFFRFAWEHSFKFECILPLERVSPGFYKYKHNSTLKSKFTFSGTKNREVKITESYIYNLVTFSFHLRHIMSFRKQHTCDQYLHDCNSVFVKQ